MYSLYQLQYADNKALPSRPACSFHGRLCTNPFVRRNQSCISFLKNGIIIISCAVGLNLIISCLSRHKHSYIIAKEIKPLRFTDNPRHKAFGINLVELADAEVSINDNRLSG